MPRFFFLQLFDKKDDDGGQEQLTQGLWVCWKVLGVSEKDKDATRVIHLEEVDENCSYVQAQRGQRQ